MARILSYVLITAVTAEAFGLITECPKRSFLCVFLHQLPFSLYFFLAMQLESMSFWNQLLLWCYCVIGL